MFFSICHPYLRHGNSLTAFDVYTDSYRNRFRIKRSNLTFTIPDTGRNFKPYFCQGPSGDPSPFPAGFSAIHPPAGIRPDTRPVFRSRPDWLPGTRPAVAPGLVLTILFLQMPQNPGKKILPYLLPVGLIEQLMAGVLIKAQGNIPAAGI